MIRRKSKTFIEKYHVLLIFHIYHQPSIQVVKYQNTTLKVSTVTQETQASVVSTASQATLAVQVE